MDISHMQHALRLAARGLGRTWPNPSVGAVVVSRGQVVASGATARSGRPHAETIALTEAGEAARGATLYVTLEPCAHTGKTPPCTDAIIAAGIARVVIACGDPNPLVAGKGAAQLKAARIDVVEGVCEAEARCVNEGFFSVMNRQRPMVALKVATSLDGKVATASGESQWITNNASRRYCHYLRGCHDAVLTGSGTVLADAPALTCRLPGRESDSPQRVVLDSSLRVSPDAALLPAWFYTSTAALAEVEKKAALETAGASIVAFVPTETGLPLAAILADLAEKGITRLLVEAGRGLSSAFLVHGLVDRLYWFRAPLIIGEHGISAFKGSDASLAALQRFTREDSKSLGADTLDIFTL